MPDGCIQKDLHRQTANSNRNIGRSFIIQRYMQTGHRFGISTSWGRTVLHEEGIIFSLVKGNNPVIKQRIAESAESIPGIG